MTTKLKVLSFDENRLVSDCLVIESDEKGFYGGRRIMIDLTVNADFDNMPEAELVGKTVEVRNFQACEFIGIGVSIVEDES